MQLTYLLDGRNLSPCGSILKKRDFSTSLITLNKRVLNSFEDEIKHH